MQFIITLIFVVFLLFIFLLMIYLVVLDNCGITHKQFMRYIEATAKLKKTIILCRSLKKTLDIHGYDELINNAVDRLYIQVFMSEAEEIIDAIDPIPSIIYQEDEPMFEEIINLYSRINLMKRGLVRS